jgi:hypothetical protein
VTVRLSNWLAALLNKRASERLTACRRRSVLDMHSCRGASNASSHRLREGCNFGCARRPFGRTSMQHGDEDRKFRGGDDEFVLSVARGVEYPQAHPYLSWLGVERASKRYRDCAGRPRRLSGLRVAHDLDVNDWHEAANVIWPSRTSRTRERLTGEALPERARTQRRRQGTSLGAGEQRSDRDHAAR